MNCHFLSFQTQVRHPILVCLREAGKNLVGNPLVELRLVLNLKPTLTSTSFYDLALLNFQLFLLSQVSPNCCTWTIKKQISILLCSIAKQNSSTRSTDTPVKKWLISALGLDTKEVAYLENLVNCKKYSYTLIPPRRRYEFFRFCLPFSIGNNQSRKDLLSTSQVIGPTFKTLLSLYWVYRVWGISLSW